MLDAHMRMTKICPSQSAVPQRRRVSYRPAMAKQRTDPRFTKPIKAMIEEVSSFGNRMEA